MTGPGAASATGPVCVLVGPPGAGKTTVGELIAKAVGRPFRDTDADIEARAGKPISEIFVDDGEPHFRDLERQAVADALYGFDGVLALGGGAVTSEEVRTALRGHRVVFLSVELSAAMSREGLTVSRPLLAVNPRATFRYLLDQRRPLYREVATVTVATDDITPEEAATRVLDALGMVTGAGADDA